MIVHHAGLRALVPLAAVLAAQDCRAQTELVARVDIPFDATDASGLTDTIGSTPHNRLGGMGSAIAWTGRDWEFVVLPDRGPSDGAAPYRTRFHLVRLEPDLGRATLQWNLQRTVMLTDEAGLALPGLSSAVYPGDRSRSHRFDPEGARLDAHGLLYISDEYGPWIDVFDSRGKRLRRIDVPPAFAVEHEAADPEEELPPHNTRGRQSNRGFEGLALTPDGRELWAILQSPLIQDGALDSKGKRVGVNVRVLVARVDGAGSRQFVYPLSHPKNGVSEILAIDDHRMLVLERDGDAGAAAERKLVYLADFEGATDVTAIEHLPATGLGGHARAADKRVILDLLDPRFGLAGETMPEKIEGLAFGPDLPDSRKTLFITTDNDFKDGVPSRVWVFALDPSALAR